MEKDEKEYEEEKAPGGFPEIHDGDDSTMAYVMCQGSGATGAADAGSESSWGSAAGIWRRA